MLAASTPSVRWLRGSASFRATNAMDLTPFSSISRL